ncbi:MAG: hypothetical protein WD906_01085 [Anaerolineales bacterium]
MNVQSTKDILAIASPIAIKLSGNLIRAWERSEPAILGRRQALNEP